jgi:hypothetical protein
MSGSRYTPSIAALVASFLGTGAVGYGAASWWFAREPGEVVQLEREERSGPLPPLREVSPSASSPLEAPPPQGQETTNLQEPAPERKFHPRDPQEWQGMRVDVTESMDCELSARCGLALACVNGKCGPCTRDAECAPAEVCVLDHCVQRDRAACESRRDCPRGQPCVISEYSPGPRGNEDMRTACLTESGPSPVAEQPRPATTEEVVDMRAPEQLGAPHVLERDVREHAIAFERKSGEEQR